MRSLSALIWMTIWAAGSTAHADGQGLQRLRVEGTVAAPAFTPNNPAPQANAPAPHANAPAQGDDADKDKGKDDSVPNRLTPQNVGPRFPGAANAPVIQRLPNGPATRPNAPAAPATDPDKDADKGIDKGAANRPGRQHSPTPAPAPASAFARLGLFLVIDDTPSMANNHTAQALQAFAAGLSHLRPVDWTAVVTNANRTAVLARANSRAGDSLVFSSRNGDLEEVASQIVRPELPGLLQTGINAANPIPLGSVPSAPLAAAIATLDAIQSESPREAQRLLADRERFAVVIWTDGDSSPETVQQELQELAHVTGGRPMDIYTIGIPLNDTQCLSQERAIRGAALPGEPPGNADVARVLGGVSLVTLSLCNPNSITETFRRIVEGARR